MTSDLEQQQPHRVTGHGDLVDPVRQLLSSVTSSLQNDPSSSQCVIEEALAQLESTDENFHSYELVRSLHRQLDTVIDPLVESRIEERVLEGDGHRVVPHITEEILASSEYDQLCQSFMADLRSAMDEILASETTPVTSHLDVSQTFHSSSCSSATQYYNLEDSTGSDLSGLHPTGLMFMSHDRLRTIANALLPSQILHVRLDAVHHLLQFPSGDLVTPENWSLLKDPVKEALGDHDDSLSDLCLKFHYRTFSAHTANTTRVAYISLAEHLNDYCQSQDGGVVTLNMGVDPSDDRCVRLLAKFRLLNYFQLDMPNYWLRYNERVVEEIIGCTFVLLSLSYLHPTLLGPAHFLALVDPKAVWFQKWMHGHYSRTFVLDLLKNRPIILQGVISQVLKFSGSSSHQTGSATPSSLDFYNEKSLEFVHFVHSVCFLERVLLYQGGRALFPFTLPDTGELVGVSDLLVRLLRLLYRISVGCVSIFKKDDERTFDPILIIAHLFNAIASGNVQCQQIMCHDDFISELIEPLKVAMTTKQCLSVSEEVIVLMADVVAILASTDKGRTQLLSGSQDGPTDKSSTLHTIAQFVIHSLSSHTSTSTPHTSTPHISPEVTSAWLVVCRQLYNTGEGLACLEPYHLHVHIARAHSKLQDSSSSRVVSGGSFFQTDTQTFSLEESLLDNLLNFAGTPKGVLLLQQSGLMAQCTQYMQHRYKLKLQVSKYEKFGYGCMVTLLASTPAGIVELNNCGFISMLVQELWGILDGGEEDYRLTVPRTHPLDPIDRVSHKAVINLLNVFSSYSALYEILNKTTHTNSQSMVSVTTLFDLLDRLVLVDSELKRSLLFNFQESHLFGLRILSTLMTCLDSCLYLDVQFNITEALLSLQEDQQLNDFIIIDACSVERNRILVSCYFIGGPNERKLPPHYLTDVSEDYNWPLFSSFPPPSVYQAPHTYNPSHSTSNTVDRDLQGLLNGSISLSSSDWLARVKHSVCSLIKQQTSLSNELIWQLLVQCVHRSQHDALHKPSSMTKLTSPSQDKLSKMDELGIKMAVRYGQVLGVLAPSLTSPHHSGLADVLSKTKRLLSSQQHSKRRPEIASMNGGYPGFDWFVSTMYLLARGSGENCWEFLRSFSSSHSSGYVWPARLHLSLLLPPELALSGVPPITSVIGHHVELILQSEVPLVSSAFRMSGYNPSQICQHWCSQCFWNFLDWSEIGLYLICCILLGIDYQVYFCVAVLKHLEAQILQHAQEQNLMVFLKEEALVDFRCGEWIDFMQALENKFRPCVLKAMRQIT